MLHQLVLVELVHKHMDVEQLKIHLEMQRDPKVTVNRMRDFQLVKNTTRGSAFKVNDMIASLDEWVVSNR